MLATKVHGVMGKGGRTAVACRARRSCTSSTPACAGSAPTTSTSTRSTGGTPATPIEETMEALHDVVKAGKVRYIGASSMWAWQFAKAQHVAERHGWTKFVTMQNHYNLVYREEEREMLPLCVDQGVGVIPWSPLARGSSDPRRRRVDRPFGDRRVREVVVHHRGRRRHRRGREDRGEPRRARGRRSRSRGCPSILRSRRRSSGRRSRITSTTRSPRSTSSSRPTRSPRSSRPTHPNPCRASSDLRLSPSVEPEPGGRYAGSLRQRVGGDHRRGR